MRGVGVKAAPGRPSRLEERIEKYILQRGLEDLSARVRFRRRSHQRDGKAGESDEATVEAAPSAKSPLAPAFS